MPANGRHWFCPRVPISPISRSRSGPRLCGPYHWLAKLLHHKTEVRMLDDQLEPVSPATCAAQEWHVTEGPVASTGHRTQLRRAPCGCNRRGLSLCGCSIGKKCSDTISVRSVGCPRSLGSGTSDGCARRCLQPVGRPWESGVHAVIVDRVFPAAGRTSLGMTACAGRKSSTSRRRCLAPSPSGWRDWG